jgi:hypothetical protein
MAHFNLIFFPTLGNENRDLKAGKRRQDMDSKNNFRK